MDVGREGGKAEEVKGRKWPCNLRERAGGTCGRVDQLCGFQDGAGGAQDQAEPKQGPAGRRQHFFLGAAAGGGGDKLQ